MDNLQTINSASETIRLALNSLSEEVQSKVEALQKTNEAIDEKNVELVNLSAEIIEKHKTYKADTQFLVEKRVTAEKLLEETEKAVKAAESKLETTMKKHADFMAYHARATTALSARESSILKREESLEATIAQSRRRKGILEDVS